MGHHSWVAARKVLAIAAAATLIFSSGASAAAKPGKVKISSGTSTSTSITLKWAAGVGAKPTKYTVTCTATGQPTKTKTLTGKSTTLSSLAPNTSYSCSIVAFAKTAKGAAMKRTILTKPTVPMAPQMPTAAPGDAKATISWTAPLSDGGSPVTGYTVTSTPGSRTCSVAGSAGASCTVTGLTNNTNYSFTVTAANAIGTGPAANTATITPIAVPDMPVITTTSADGEVTLNWEHPLNATVTKYVVTKVGSASVDVAYPSKSYKFTGLPNCQPINFTVYAENASGQSITANVTAAAGGISARAGEVQGLNVVAGDKKLTVSFLKPLAQGLKPITSYQVRAYLNGQYTTGVATNAMDSVPMTYEITGLNNGVLYEVSALAVSDCGVAEPGLNSVKSATPVWSGKPARVVDMDKGQISNVSIGSGEKLGYQFTNYLDMTDPSRWYSLTLTCHQYQSFGSPTDYYADCPQSINTELASVQIYSLDGTALGVATAGGGWVNSSGKWYYYFRPALAMSYGQTYIVVVTYGTPSAFQVAIPGTDPIEYDLFDTGRKIDFWPYEIRS
mgnify:CR=1 FL=1